MEELNQIPKDLVLYNLVKLKQLVFEITDACNLHCKYCAYAEMYDGYDQRTNMNLPFSKAKLVIDYLQDLWKRNKYHDLEKHVYIGFYGGEP